MIGSSDDSGVNAFAGENLSKIGVGSAILVLIALIDQIAGLLQLVLFHIADSHYPGIVFSQKSFHYTLTLRAGADKRYGDFVAGSNGPAAAESSSGNNSGKCQTGQRDASRFPQKMATAKLPFRKVTHDCTSS